MFDIASAKVINEYKESSEPLSKMAYSPTGSLLVIVCVNGTVTLHNSSM